MAAECDRSLFLLMTLGACPAPVAALEARCDYHTVYKVTNLAPTRAHTSLAARIGEGSTLV